MAEESAGEARGFARADCAACGGPDSWMRCEKCGRADDFLVEDGVAICGCSARWSSATCLCGESVPGERLRPVRFEDGPAALGSYEIDPVRAGTLGVVLLALIGLALGWWLSG